MIPIVVYGITIIAITLMFLLLYTPITVIFFVDREYRKSSAYIIMTHIAITDIAQLLIHCYTGVLVVLQTQPVYWVDKFLGAILTGLWFCMLTFTLFLNYNRLAIIMLNRCRELKSKYIVVAWYGLCYLSFVIPFAMKLFPDNNYLFVMTGLYWGPPATDGDTSRIQRAVSNYFILVVVISSILTYAAIFLYIGLISNSKLTKRELRITIQISFVVGYFLFSFFYWNYLGMVIPMNGMFWDYLSMMVWVVMNGIHAVIYLIFNEKLRISFFRLLFKGQMPDSVSSQNVLFVARSVSKWPIPPRTSTNT